MALSKSLEGHFELFLPLAGIANVVLSKLLEVHDIVTESWLPVPLDPGWLALHIAENLICNLVSAAQWFGLSHLTLFFTGFVDPSIFPVKAQA